MSVAGPGETLLPLIKNEIRAVRTALWFRPTAFCLAAAAAATLLATVDGLLPEAVIDGLPEVAVEVVQELMKLLAGSMLTVATVTLSVLMLVLSLAAGQASPRAVPEIMADPVTQNALGSFLATFVYALTALLLFGFEVVGEGGATLLFFGAIVLVLNALRYLVQWIHHVADILKVNRMIHRIHRQAGTVLQTYLASDPAADCEPLPLEKKDSVTVDLRSGSTGYVQLIDAPRLHSLACKHELAVELCVQEGDFVHPRRRLMQLRGTEAGDSVRAALQATVVIGFERSHEGDPRLGFELLAEVACRALSPGINDPQSALACIEHLGGLLAMAGAQAPAEYPAAETPDGRVGFRRCRFDALLERAFRPIIRDGAACAEVILAIMDILHELARDAAPVYLEQILDEAARAEAYGREKLVLETDRDALSERWRALNATAEGRV
jgi:uncharacterized membrane protein